MPSTRTEIELEGRQASGAKVGVGLGVALPAGLGVGVGLGVAVARGVGTLVRVGAGVIIGVGVTTSRGQLPQGSHPDRTRTANKPRTIGPASALKADFMN